MDPEVRRQEDPEVREKFSFRRYDPSDSSYLEYRAFVARAVEVFGDEFVANKWLTTPQEALENRSPLDVAQDKSFDLRVLDQLLGRLEHGVFA